MMGTIDFLRLLFFAHFVDEYNQWSSLIGLGCDVTFSSLVVGLLRACLFMNPRHAIVP